MSTAAPSTWSEDLLVSAGVWRVTAQEKFQVWTCQLPTVPRLIGGAPVSTLSSHHQHHLLLTLGNTFLSHLLNPFSNYLIEERQGKSFHVSLLEIFSFSDSISTFHSEMASYDPCSQVHEYWDLSNIPIFNFRDKTKYSKLIKQILKFPRY